MTVDEFLELAGEWNGGTKDLQILAESGHVHIVPLTPQAPFNMPEEHAEL
jgi:hypothetical protein